MTENPVIRSANWHFTAKCNYSCKFCTRQNIDGEITSAEAVNTILTSLKRLGIEKLNIVGGGTYDASPVL